jgi:hypothetical protein
MEQGAMLRLSWIGRALNLTACFCFAQALDVATGAMLSPRLRPSGLLSVRSLRVAGLADEGSRLFLGAPGASFSIGTDASGSTFSIQKESLPATPSTPPNALLALDAEDVLHIGAQRVQALSLTTNNGLAFRGVAQWQLARQEDFSQQGFGWSRPAVTKCGGVSMLGGFCRLSKGEVNKTFMGLPPHKQVRVVATYHFIDRWIGETGYMKLNVGQAGQPVALWSEQHSQAMSKNGISLCGQAGTPEGKFSALIDVTVEHTQDSVEVAFGSTMDDSDPCDESWGVSGVEIYTRA